VQKEANIIRKEAKRGYPYRPSYIKGGYMAGKEREEARDLRLEDAKEVVEIVPDTKLSEGKKVNEKVTEVIVEKGDTLLKYQREYGVDANEIAKLNNIKKPYNIYVGQKIKIRGAAQKPQGEKIEYKTVRVEKGDNLLGLSIEHGSTLMELAKLNDISAPYNIYAGQKLKVPIRQGGAKSTRSDTKEKNVYIVEKGDSLLLIAKKTNTKFGDLIKINNLSKPYNVYVGQKIYLNGNNIAKKSSTEQKIEQKSSPIPQQPQRTVVANNNNGVVVVKNVSNDFLWPLNGVVLKNFGDNNNGKFFDGIIIKGSKGEAIKSADDGEVVYVGNELKDLGNIVIIKHKNNWLTIYGYCDSVNIKIKDAVKKGEVIASVGKTGSASDYQLYFAIRRGKVAVDPIKYLPNNK
jgi:lipoprotein NlpD